MATVVGIVLILSVAVFRRHLPYTGMNLAPAVPPPVVMTIEDARIIGVSGGVKLWSVRAKNVELAQNRLVVTLDNVTDGSVFDKGNSILSIRAGRITYNIAARDMQLSKGVTIAGSRGQRITAAGAVWNSYTGILRSTTHVAFESPLGRMKAEELVVNVRNRRLQMSNVVGSANIEAMQEPVPNDARNAN
ncbi:MAG: LPS export ABC transporter periplasmic protein LptC [Armatimonadota bacterium]